MTTTATLQAATTRYFDALAAGDFPTATSMFAEDIVWHQPGDNRFSGTHNGGAAVGEMIGDMMESSAGSFKISVIGTPMVNGALVATAVRFSAQREEDSIAMDGVDLMRFDGDQIVEVWLFSEDQGAENAFWGAAN